MLLLEDILMDHRNHNLDTQSSSNFRQRVSYKSTSENWSPENQMVSFFVIHWHFTGQTILHSTQSLVIMLEHTTWWERTIACWRSLWVSLVTWSGPKTISYASLPPMKTSRHASNCLFVYGCFIFVRKACHHSQSHPSGSDGGFEY